MECSAKISRSACLYLEQKSLIAGDYLERSGLTSELALDSERWVDAYKLEQFLDLISKENDEISPKDIALAAPQIKGWGLLDQVLRIIQSSSDIYQKPKTFLSYFLKEDLSLIWLEKEEERSSFQAEFSSEEFPMLTSYLEGAFEAVSLFSGEEQARVTWAGQNVLIDWSKNQNSIFKEEEPKQLKPELLMEAVELMQKQQGELSSLKQQALTPASFDESQKEELLYNLKLLEDYFLRSRQLIALLKAESGQKKWFKEALKRLDWENLQSSFAERSANIKGVLKGSQGGRTEKKQESFNLEIQ